MAVTPALAAVVVETMHSEERAHVARWGLTPQQAVGKVLELCPRATVAVIDGEVLGLFGVVPDPNDGTRGVPWLLTTEAVKRHPVESIRAARTELKRLRTCFPVLENDLFLDEPGSIRLAEAIGFKRRPYIDQLGTGPVMQPICLED